MSSRYDSDRRSREDRHSRDDYRSREDRRSRDDRHHDDDRRRRSRDDRESHRHSQVDEDPPEVHAIFKGEVAAVQKYGVFVKMPGYRKQGLVHVSQMANRRTENPYDVVSVGERVYVKVISVQENGQKIGLSMKAVDQRTGEDRGSDMFDSGSRGRGGGSHGSLFREDDDDDGPARSHFGRSSDDGPQLYTIFKGEIVTLHPYGVFVKIPGSKKQGLVHKSQMSSTKVENPSDMAEVGDRVYCKVISVQDGGQKIGLSMKVVNQTTGEDQDPNQVQTALDEQRRKQGHTREIPKIQLGAVLDTTCKKCGGKGHLAQDCFHIPGSKTYNLVGDDDDDEDAESPDDGPTPSKYRKEKKKKNKKEKKKKEKKKKKRHSKQESDSDDSSSSYESPKKKKKKKRRYSDSSDSSLDSPPSHSKRSRH